MRRNPFVFGLAAAVFVVALSGVARSSDMESWGSGSSEAPVYDPSDPSGKADTPAYQESGPMETGSPSAQSSRMERGDVAQGGHEDTVEFGGSTYRRGIDEGP